MRGAAPRHQSWTNSVYLSAASQLDDLMTEVGARVGIRMGYVIEVSLRACSVLRLACLTATIHARDG